MSNEDDQSDEIMVLRSIYGEDVFMCNATEKPYIGSIVISVDLEFKEHDFLRNGNVVKLKHLTPVILNFILPSAYPSETPPDFDISCLWLSTEQVEHLSNLLKDRWKESCSAILFSWLDLIKTETFELLNLKYPLEITDEKLTKLIEINHSREEEIFQRSKHFCPVCLTDVPGPECVKLSECEHVFCKECLSGYLSVNISDGNVRSLICPAKDCEDTVDAHVIKSLVSDTDFERYDRLLLQNTLDIMSDVIYCPRRNCNKPVIIEGEDRTGFCHSCKFAFCTRCKLTYHGIEPCKFEEQIVWRRRNAEEETTPVKIRTKVPRPSYKIVHGKSLDSPHTFWAMSDDEKMQIALDYVKGDKEVREGFEKFYGRKTMHGMVEDFKTKSFMNAFTRSCPCCNAPIMRYAGCSHMKCKNCHTGFIWLISGDEKKENISNLLVLESKPISKLN